MLVMIQLWTTNKCDESTHQLHRQRLQLTLRLDHPMDNLILVSTA